MILLILEMAGRMFRTSGTQDLYCIAPLVGYAALAAFQVMSGNQQAAAIGASAEMKKVIDDMNANYAELDAYEAEKQGITDTARYQNVIDSTIAEQRAGFAAQGVDVNYGTAAELQAESRLTGFLNTLDIQKKAREHAYGLKRDAINYRAGGMQAIRQGQSDASGVQTAGYINAASTGLSGYDRYQTNDNRQTHLPPVQRIR